MPTVPCWKKATTEFGMRYLPHTEQEVQQMLAAIGKPSLDALFESIPSSARFERELAVPPPLDEASLMRHMKELATKNNGCQMLSFLGGGMYDHHLPPA